MIHVFSFYSFTLSAESFACDFFFPIHCRCRRSLRSFFSSLDRLLPHTNAFVCAAGHSFYNNIIMMSDVVECLFHSNWSSFASIKIMFWILQLGDNNNKHFNSAEWFSRLFFIRVVVIFTILLHALSVRPLILRRSIPRAAKSIHESNEQNELICLHRKTTMVRVRGIVSPVGVLFTNYGMSHAEWKNGIL